MNKAFATLLLLATSSFTPAIAQADKLDDQIHFYDQRYKLEDPFTKLVDNQGNGYASLYGTRNLRSVLTGIYYRGGANNTYNKYGKRNNENPLPAVGLKNLCQEGFTDAVYLYPTNFATAAKTTSCTSVSGGASQMNYTQISALTKGNEHPLLTLVHEHLVGTRSGPIYIHCWNGWHASGYVAAISLRQFCNWSADQAVAYWIKNTDGNSAGHQSIIDNIRNFKPFADLTVSSAFSGQVCPQATLP